MNLGCGGEKESWWEVETEESECGGVRIKESAEGKGSRTDLRLSGGKLVRKGMEVYVTY
jgi:hypothetical protein